MTALNSQILQTDAQIGDIKQARQLLQNLILTNPKHAPGWIAAASLEGMFCLSPDERLLNKSTVHAKKMVQARKIIAEGCEKCPKSEDIWFHAAELNVSGFLSFKYLTDCSRTPENAKVILGKAVQQVPQSIKIWMKAASLETDATAKKRVLRKGEWTRVCKRSRTRANVI